MSPAKDYSQLISRWNQINKVKMKKDNILIFSFQKYSYHLLQIS